MVGGGGRHSRGWGHHTTLALPCSHQSHWPGQEPGPLVQVTHGCWLLFRELWKLRLVREKGGGCGVRQTWRPRVVLAGGHCVALDKFLRLPGLFCFV